MLPFLAIPSGIFWASAVGLLLVQNICKKVCSSFRYIDEQNCNSLKKPSTFKSLENDTELKNRGIVIGIELEYGFK